MNRSDFQRLARIRLKEVRALIEAKCFDGAYYLCGYVIEFALKACIAKSIRRYEFPDLPKLKDCYSHDLPRLIKLAGLEVDHQAELKSNGNFQLNWTIVKDWSENARYAQHSKKKARDLYRAIANQKHGVMRWIRKYW